MPNLPFTARDRAELYAKQHNVTITLELGGGYDGYVVGTDSGTVIKSLNSPTLYRNELKVYRHLKKLGISELSGFRIPKLIDSDDDNSIIVMTLVKPPYAVDFACASLTKWPQFEPEIMEEWRNQKREEFGDDWSAVKRLMFAFESRGIFLSDVHPRNIACR